MNRFEIPDRMFDQLKSVQSDYDADQEKSRQEAEQKRSRQEIAEHVARAHKLGKRVCRSVIPNGGILLATSKFTMIENFIELTAQPDSQVQANITQKHFRQNHRFFNEVWRPAETMIAIRLHDSARHVSAEPVPLLQFDGHGITMFDLNQSSPMSMVEPNTDNWLQMQGLLSQLEASRFNQPK